MVVLLLLIFSTLIDFVAGDATCSSARKIGELRIYKSKLCLDTPDAGQGNVKSHRCDGGQDQQIIFCTDGTIRNMAINYCLTPKTDDGKGNLSFKPCQLYPEISAHQKFRLGRNKTFTDTGGILQTVKEYINQKSGLCMDVDGSGGNGDIGMFTCTGEDDQYYYFRNRGKLMQSGRLHNQKSGECAAAHTSTYSNVATKPCNNDDLQWWKFYENGEIVNQKSGMCMVPGKSDGAKGRDIKMASCDDVLHQMWETPEQYSDGDFLGFLNKKKGFCLDVSGNTGKGNLLLWTCDGTQDQRFEWIKETWTAPDSMWRVQSCSEGGSFKYEISNTVEYSSEVSTEVALEVGAAIEADLLFLKFSVDASISASIAGSWRTTNSVTTSTTFSCDWYDNGEPFKGGCMWQFYLETSDMKDVKLSWNAKIIRCTKGIEAPGCPPFTDCVDEACTQCVGDAANAGETSSNCVGDTANVGETTEDIIKTDL